jgi:hypothetical protein
LEKSPIEQRYSMLSVAHWFSFSNPPLTAENGITDICSAVFVFCGPNNGPNSGNLELHFYTLLSVKS